MKTTEVLLFIMLSQLAQAATTTPDEMYEARRWVAAKWEGGAEVPLPEARLIVLANNDTVQKDARAGRPLRIADRQFHQGLFCHAVSEAVVRLPGAGRTFTAVAGVDSNEQTLGGRGSVVFAVKVGNQERFRSEVMREGMAGVPVTVDLGGAAEFTLEVGDAGDGIGCDQADWAEAKVTLADGRTVWLSDMVMEHPHQAQYTPEPPFSFTYGGQSSVDLLPAWELQRNTRKLDDQRTSVNLTDWSDSSDRQRNIRELDGQRIEHTLTYTDPQTGLVVRGVAVEYQDFPTVEWTLYFKNTGAADTPILENVQALDTRLERYRWPDYEFVEFVLHHHTGSPCTPADYEPHRTVLKPQTEQRISGAGGRPTNSDLPYFNVEWPSEGVIVVVGWPGQWAAQFTRDEGVGMRVRAGQELTHFTLHPGEEVRTPLIVLQFWKGDRRRAQNTWRRWMLAHNLPRVPPARGGLSPAGGGRGGGQLPPAQMAACSSHQFGEMIHANEENQKFFVDRYLEEGIPLDYWWMDAGWYVNQTGWPNTGTWEVDTQRFPRGLRAITDHAHAKGVRSIVWFEPERVTPGTWLTENHPEWIFGGANGGLLNLGNPEARQWLTDHVDQLINEQGIDLYRNDFNIDPLLFWRANDAEDRQGITEIRYVEGFLAYWDELRRRHPDMLIDTCASGGRRNDLETLRRAVPLLRSDYILEPVSQQNHTYGIASWVPFYGTGVNSTDPYVFRSQMCPHITGCYDMRNRDQDFATLRRLYQQWRNVGPYYFGDYYPLTPYSLDPAHWMAWQFDHPGLGEGMVQVFRRADSVYEAARFRLQGLDPEARYTVQNLDAEGTTEAAGRELMEKGLLITLPHQPEAAVVTYKQVKERAH